jgi:hypothetical protein
MDEIKETEHKTREEVLASSLEAREQEIMYYQINIDNYAIALKKIAELPPSEQFELSSFSEQLNTLLTSEKLEQKKAKIMLSAIQEQVI